MKIKTYFFDDVENFSHLRFLHLLSDERRQKAMRYKKAIDQKLSVSAFLLLRLALRDFDFFDMPQMGEGEYGKPFLTNAKGLHFNISHCKKGAVAAVCRHEIGIDIQDIRPATNAVINKTMCDEEKEHIYASQHAEISFAKLWSKKESILKKSGKGISGGLLSVNTLRYSDLDTFEGDGFFISLAGGEICLEKVTALDFERLFSFDSK